MATVNDTLKIGGETLAKNTEALLEVLDEHLKKEEWLVNMYARRIPKDLLLDLDKKLENAIKEDNKELGDVWVLGFVSKLVFPFHCYREARAFVLKGRGIQRPESRRECGVSADSGNCEVHLSDDCKLEVWEVSRILLDRYLVELCG